MSKKHPGGIIRGTPVVPTTSSAPGIWTVCQAQTYTQQGIWPRIPGAPTIGTATAGGASATVAFTAPSDLGAGSLSYRATSSPGGITGTGTSSPITVSGLTIGTAYTFTVVGITPGGTGPASAASNSVTPTPVQGQQAYTSGGTYSWVAPTGVTSVSVIAVGGGARGGGTYQGGGGGGLRYRNGICVMPGNSYTVIVGSGGTSGSANGGTSSFINVCTLNAGGGTAGSGMGGGVGGTGSTIGGSIGGGNGGRGGTNNASFFGGGGGAGGYSGNGGAGANQGPAGCKRAGNNGSGGGGAGGSGGSSCCGFNVPGGGGGGVGLLGAGASGTGNTDYAGGGSGGNNGCFASPAYGIANGAAGGAYGGGGGSSAGSNCAPYMGTGAGGAVRIIWPGTTRSFPSTCTGNL